MKVRLKRLNDAVNFEARNDEGAVMLMDGSPDTGGQNLGVRPMQALLMAMGGCSGIDIVMILKKQRQQITGFDIEIDGEREQGKEPALWKNIHATFHLSGEIDPEKAKRAAALSLEKYCSVAKTLEATATITWSVTLNGNPLS